MDKTKLGIIMISAILCIGIGTSAWYFGYGPTVATGFVVLSEDAKIEFNDDFEMYTFNSSGSEVQKSNNITIVNYGKERNMTAVINTTISDSDPWDGCNISGDVEVLIEFNDEEIQDGDIVTINEITTSILNVTTKAVPYSCPQLVTTNIIIE